MFLTAHPRSPLTKVPSQITLAPFPPNPHQTIWSDFPPLKRIRRQLRSLIYRLPDTGLPGLTPLRTHILICGYPRAGTTLLQAMLEHALPHARSFGEETSGWRAATYAWRNHSVLLSKVPNDLFRLHSLKNFYANRKAKLRIIIMIRDPRDVLTSHINARDSDQYVTDLSEWRRYHDYFLHHRADPDVLVLRYEDLVADPQGSQSRIDSFTGEPATRPSSEFYRANPRYFDATPLNGVRPIDTSAVGRWSSPQHATRISQALQEIPDLPEILIDLGYESNHTWTTAYRA